MGTNLTNQNSIEDEIKRRLISRNACFHSAQNILFSRFISKNIQNYNFTCCLYGCETWSLTMWEERRLSLFLRSVLRTMIGSNKNEVTESGENYIMRSLMICTLHHIFFGDQIKKNEVGGAGSMCT